MEWILGILAFFFFFPLAIWLLKVACGLLILIIAAPFMLFSKIFGGGDSDSSSSSSGLNRSSSSFSSNLKANGKLSVVVTEVETAPNWNNVKRQNPFKA